MRTKVRWSNFAGTRHLPLGFDFRKAGDVVLHEALLGGLRVRDHHGEALETGGGVHLQQRVPHLRGSHPDAGLDGCAVLTDPDATEFGFRVRSGSVLLYHERHASSLLVTDEMARPSVFVSATPGAVSYPVSL